MPTDPGAAAAHPHRTAAGPSTAAGRSTAGWTVAAERAVYDSAWLRVTLADVTAPDGHHVPEHHVVRLPAPVVGTVVTVDGAVLLMWRHRFITGVSGWEIPAGRAEPGEDLVAAAVRETVEETGWRPEGLVPLRDWYPCPGLTDHHFHAFLARRAVRVGDPVDTHEAERIVWLPEDEVAAHVASGELRDGMALPALDAFLRLRGGAPA